MLMTYGANPVVLTKGQRIAKDFLGAQKFVHTGENTRIRMGEMKVERNYFDKRKVLFENFSSIEIRFNNIG